MFKVCGIVGISKVKILNFSSTERDNGKLHFLCCYFAKDTAKKKKKKRKKKRNFPLGISSVNVKKSFIEEILNGKLHLLCSETFLENANAKFSLASESFVETLKGNVRRGGSRTAATSRWGAL